MKKLILTSALISFFIFCLRAQTSDFDGTDGLSLTLSGGNIQTGAASFPLGNSFGNLGNGWVVNNGMGIITSASLTTTNPSVFSFDLASLSGSSGNGADGPDYVLVEVSIDGGSTFSEEMQVYGNSNAQWTYTGGGGTAATNYDGDNSPITQAPAGGGLRDDDGDGIALVQVTGIPAGNIVIRLTILNNAANEHWAVDNLAITLSTCPLTFSVSTPVCSAITAGTDPYTVSINFFGAGQGVNTYTISPAYTGDNPDILTSGTMTFTGTEGTDISLSIVSADCNIMQTIPSPACDVIPDIIINEFLADPDATNGDANGDGTVNTTQDEFVELYNNEPTDVDISGWMISDGNGVRHIFGGGSILPTGEFAIVFGGGTPTNVSGHIVDVASSGALGLNNTGDDIIVANSNGNTIVSYTYGSEGGNNKAIGRNPDFTGPFVDHDIIAVIGRLFSPGLENNSLPIHTATTDVCTTADGSITTTMNNDWQPITHNGELLAEINDMGNDMGNVNIDFYISTTPREDGSGTNYLNRTLFINPTNNTPAMVRIYFTDADLQDIITESAGESDEVTSLNDLIVTKVEDNICDATAGDTGSRSTLVPEHFTYGGDYYIEFSVTGFSAFSIHGGTVILPVELGDFTAEVRTKDILLSWQTLTEENVSHFAVEKSHNGMDFTAKDDVFAVGNSQVRQEYSFVDEQPVEGNNYYRLNMVDEDGSSQYSRIVSAHFLDQENMIVVYHPLSNQIEVRSAVTNRYNSLQLYNAMGSVVHQQKINDAVFSISTQGLAKGSYYLRLIGKASETIPVLVY